jgi:hypothetical protein
MVLSHGTLAYIRVCTLKFEQVSPITNGCLGRFQNRLMPPHASALCMVIQSNILPHPRCKTRALPNSV